MKTSPPYLGELELVSWLGILALMSLVLIFMMTLEKAL